MIKYFLFFGLLASMVLFFVSLVTVALLPINVDHLAHALWAQMQMIGSLDSKVFWGVFLRA